MTDRSISPLARMMRAGGSPATPHGGVLGLISTIRRRQRLSNGDVPEWHNQKTCVDDCESAQANREPRTASREPRGLNNDSVCDPCSGCITRLEVERMDGICR